MAEKSITLVTGNGGSLGTGHLQRMLNLAEYLTLNSKIRVYMVDGTPGSNTSGIPARYFSNKIPGKTSLIIRDLRDSAVAEIQKMKKTAPVMVIDDAGPGRHQADFSLDLLPALHKHENLRSDLFLYGYNFTRSVREIKKKEIEKSIDVLIYPGHEYNKQYISLLLSLVPDNCSVTLLGSNNMPYAQIILSSRILISHFGILVYEGALAGNSIITINPSEYHSRLAEKAGKQIPLMNAGTAGEINRELLTKTIIEQINNYEISKVKITDTLSIIEENLKGFLTLIREIIQ